MRIGIYGNDNNLGLLYAAALVQLGHSAKLVLTRAHAAHRPEGFDERFRTSYPDWIFDAGQHQYAEYICQTPRLGDALNFLDDCDLLVLNHVGISLAALWAKPYVCLLTGVDLLVMGDIRSIYDLTAGWDPSFRRSAAGRLNERTWLQFLARQRDAISAAAAVIHPPRGVMPRADTLLDELGVDDDRRELVVAVPQPRAAAVTAGGERLRVVCVTPPRWPDSLPAAVTVAYETGLDALLTGIRTFRTLRPNAPIDVNVIGDDADETPAARLVAESGLDECVSWRVGPTVAARTEAIAGADIVLDPFRAPVCSPAAWTGVAAGRPVIGEFGDAWGRCFAEPIPACSADGPDAIARTLTELCDDAGIRQGFATRARRFALKHLSLPGQLERVLATL